MRTIMIVAAGTLLATAAQAQLGGQVTGGVQSAVGGVGQVGAGVTGAAQADPALPDARDTVRPAMDRSTRAVARSARDRNAVRVDTGASVRVARGRRCYYDDSYYDPAYRDGAYYCERSGTAVSARGRERPALRRQP